MNCMYLHNYHALVFRCTLKESLRVSHLECTALFIPVRTPKECIDSESLANTQLLMKGWMETGVFLPWILISKSSWMAELLNIHLESLRELVVCRAYESMSRSASKSQTTAIVCQGPFSSGVSPVLSLLPVQKASVCCKPPCSHALGKDTYFRISTLHVSWKRFMMGYYFCRLCWLSVFFVKLFTSHTVLF